MLVPRLSNHRSFGAKHSYTDDRTKASYSNEMHVIGKSRIGHTEARVKTLRHVGDRPLHDEWAGLAEVEGIEVQFTTDCQELTPGKKYHIVYERTEILPDDSGIRIHEIIR